MATALLALAAVAVLASLSTQSGGGTHRTTARAASGHLSPPTTRTPTTVAVSTAAASTTAVSQPPPTPAAALGPGARRAFLRLVARLQSDLRAGTLVGVGAAPDAVLRCPYPVLLAPGHAFACRVSSQALGSAILVAELGPGGAVSPFVGDSIGCSGLSIAGRQALEAIGAACDP